MASRALTAWNDRRRELARLLLTALTAPAQRDERVRQLTDEKERLERQLAELIPEFARDSGLTLRPHCALIQALPDGLVVLDFAQYLRREQDPEDQGERRPPLHDQLRGFRAGPRKARPEGGPRPGGRDQPGRARVASGDRQGTAQLRRGHARHLVWEPMARQFPTSTRTVVIVPDGFLTAIPWVVLPGERPGTFLVEQHALVIAPHAPFVLDLSTTPRSALAGQGTLLAVGGMPAEGSKQSTSWRR